MRYLIPIAFFILPVLAFAAGQDAGAVDTTSEAAVRTAPAGDWNEWVRSSPLGQLLTGAFVSVLMLGITKIRGAITDRAGALSVAALALFGGVSSAVIGSQPLDSKLVEVTVVVLLSAIGGYTFVKKLAFPSDSTSSQKGQGTASGELTVKEPPPLPPPPPPPEAA